MIRHAGGAGDFGERPPLFQVRLKQPEAFQGAPACFFGERAQLGLHGR